MTFQMISRHETCKCVHVLFKRVQPFLYCSKPLWGYCWGSSLHPIIFWGWGRFALCTYPCSFFTLIRSHIHHPNFLINMARPKRSWIALLLGTSNIFQHCVWNLSELYLGIFGPLPETAWAKAASQASNFQDSTLTFARLGASQSIDVGLDVGQVASLPSSSVSSERSSEVSLGCCIFPIRIAVVDGHPMVPSGNQTVTLLDGKISCTDDFRINLPFIGDFPLRCSMAGGHPHVQTWQCIHSWTWHEDVHFAENLEEHLRAYRHDPHGFWDMHEKRKHSSYKSGVEDMGMIWNSAKIR